MQMKAVASLLVLLAAAAPLARAQGAKDRTPLDVAEDLNLSTFLAVLEATGLNATMADFQGTLLAPVDAAFSEALALAAANGLDLLDPDNVDVLQSVVLYHALPDKVLSTDLEDGMVVETLSETGANLTVKVDSGKFYFVDVNGREAKVITEDQKVNGNKAVLHVIDKVLIPLELAPVAPPPAANVVAPPPTVATVATPSSGASAALASAAALAASLLAAALLA